MSPVHNQDLVQCPNCGASARPETTTCPACGAPVSHTDFVAQRKEKFKQMIEDANQELAQAGSGAAESAFGLGCSLGTILGVLVLALVFLLGSRNWILLGILAVGVATVAAGASAVIASRAKSATIATTYERSVKPEIEKNLQAGPFSRQDFRTLADDTLNRDAPLRRFLSLPSENEIVPPENQP